MTVHQDTLYVLDGVGQSVLRFLVDEQGRLSGEQESWTWGLPSSMEAESEARILDMDWVDAANGRLTPALVMLTSEGSMLELHADGSVRQIPTAGAAEWQDPQSLGTYSGNLYVLDPGYENILKYIPSGDDYGHVPTDYIQPGADVSWPDVKDMAIDGFVYLLLSDGTIKKFAGGQPQAFPQEGLYPPLRNPAGIFACADSDSVFVAEPEHGRIVQFTREGQFVRQYRATFDGEDPLTDLRELTVDLDHGRLIAATSSDLYSASLPTLH